MATSEQGDLLEIIIAHFGGYDMKLGIRVAHSETITRSDTYMYTHNAQIVAGSHVHVHVHNHESSEQSAYRDVYLTHL